MFTRRKKSALTGLPGSPRLLSRQSEASCALFLTKKRLVSLFYGDIFFYGKNLLARMNGYVMGHSLMGIGLIGLSPMYSR